MAENKDSQAAFMEAVGSIKEYAKVNGNIVTREDVHSFFKDMALDDAKFQMISGYLMANGIKIQGEDSVDNEFLKLMERPEVPPEKRPSVMMAQELYSSCRPFSSSWKVKAVVPKRPRRPIKRSTQQSPAWICPARRA